MSTPDPTLIGRLIDIQGGRLIATLFPAEDGFLSAKTIEGESLPVGQLGSLVEVRDQAGHILAEIARSHEKAVGTRTVQGEANAAPRQVTVRERRLELTALGEINGDGRLEPGVSRYPVVGATVHLIPTPRLSVLLARKTQVALELGRLSVRPALKATLEPTALFGRHLAILGQSGAGKSWTLSSLMQRVVKTMPHSHIVLLDLHGEYGWKRPDGTTEGIFPPGTARYLDARELEIPYWLLTYSELVDLFIDRADVNASLQIAFLRESVYALRKQSNQHAGIDRLSVDSPVYFPIEELYQRFKKANEEKLEFGKVKGPLFGAFDDFLVRFLSLYNDGRYDFFMHPRKNKSSASLEGLLRDFVGLGEPKRQVTVIDLSPIPVDLRPVLSAQIGRLAYEFNYWNPRRHEFPLLLVCEEAHQYIPRESDTRFVGTRRSMERIAKEGRKYGVTLCIVSQRPTELSETVLAQCGNYLCLRISNADDQEYVRRLLPEGAKNLADRLASLRRGEVLAVGDAALLPTRIQVDRPDPPPSSSDAPFSQSWMEGPEDLDVADIIDRWWRQVR
jgi:DNA helicase HerA-like ATPase